LPWRQTEINNKFFFLARFKVFILLAMAEELKKQGLFVDESYVLRVLEPNVAKDTQDLKEENEVFLESKFCHCYHSFKFSRFLAVVELTDFRKAIQDITTHLESFASEVDKQKMLAINQQNLANSSAKQKEIEQQQIQTKIIEKTLELDRLKIELQYLQRCESEMQEVFDNFYQNQ
jgi:intraflagellar transport protein 20